MLVVLHYPTPNKEKDNCFLHIQHKKPRLQLITTSIVSSDRLIGYQKPGFQVLEVSWRNRFKASLTRIFFIFCQIFGILDDFVKVKDEAKALENFEISSNMPKRDCSIPQ